MTSSIYKYVGTLVLCLALVLTAAGCNTSNDGNTTRQGQSKQYKARSTAHRTVKNEAKPSTDQKVSDEIAKRVSGVKGVSKATVIVQNHDAIVGIDVKAGEDVKKVEQQVRREAERAESGYKVHVTSDRKLHTRIQSIRAQMKPLDGHPIRNFTEDVGTLIRDIGRTATAPLR